ncbi:hypothetical protein GHT09_018914 [Marmota monax]|uniref:Uncharacterized protein n=1 Tax=Marmota monax TaxID=9995 RepID=A0A834PZC6_MARMO|nr:hypothetical protein GHT09_018914 [Marmota monax]
MADEPHTLEAEAESGPLSVVLSSQRATAGALFWNFLLPKQTALPRLDPQSRLLGVDVYTVVIFILCFKELAKEAGGWTFLASSCLPLLPTASASVPDGALPGLLPLSTVLLESPPRLPPGQHTHGVSRRASGLRIECQGRGGRATAARKKKVQDFRPKHPSTRSNKRVGFPLCSKLKSKTGSLRRWPPGSWVAFTRVHLKLPSTPSAGPSTPPA